MATNTRPELSDRSKWWISKHRYYELKHFCLQFPEWEKKYNELDGLPRSSAFVREPVNEGKTSDPTAVYAEARDALQAKMNLVINTAYEVCNHQFWFQFLVEAVIYNTSFDVMEAQKGIMPVSRNEWYELYRKFFWVLDKHRD